MRCRGYSLGLQRALCDFGADSSFARAAEKVKEHYGMEVPVRAIRAITLEHAAQMRDRQVLETQLPDGGVRRVIVETDGTLVPVIIDPKNWTTG